MTYEFNPFQKWISDQELLSENDIQSHEIASAFSDIDCIKYHHEFVQFIDLHENIIRNDNSLILSVVRIMIGIEDIKGIKLRNKIEQLVNFYEHNFINTSIKEIDIEIALNFLRCFLDYEMPTKLCILAVVLRIRCLDSTDQREDLRNVINNHRDVLEMIYGNEELTDYGYVLDDTLNDVFRKL